MFRVVLGVLKGALVGVAVGMVAWKLQLTSGVLAFAVYGMVGALVGVICGKPLWRQETLWTPLLKGIFGFGVGLGIFWVMKKVFGATHLPFATGLGAPDRPFIEIPYLLGPLIGILYGIFVEVDDGASGQAAVKATKP
jgi:hypothetical protein